MRHRHVPDRPCRRRLIRHRWLSAAVWVLEDNGFGRRFYERLGGISLGIAKTLAYRGTSYPAIREMAYGWADLRRARWLVDEPDRAEMSARSARWRAPCAALAVVLTACQGDPRRRAPGEAARGRAGRPSTAPAAGPSTAHEPRLCTVLANVVASEPAGFAPLRGRGSPPGNGSVGPSCRGPSAAPSKARRGPWPLLLRRRAACPREGDGARGTFEAFAADLDQCLVSPIWFPRTWRRGSAFEFAMGERLQAWTDHSTSPPSQVVLKVQQDAQGAAYRVRLDVQTVP